MSSRKQCFPASPLKIRQDKRAYSKERVSQYEASWGSWKQEPDEELWLRRQMLDSLKSMLEVMIPTVAVSPGRGFTLRIRKSRSGMEPTLFDVEE